MDVTNMPVSNVTTPIKSLSASDLAILTTLFKNRSQILKHLGYDDSGKSYKMLSRRAEILGVELPARVVDHRKKCPAQILPCSTRTIPPIAFDILTRKDFTGWLRRCMPKAAVLRELGHPVCSRTYTQLTARAKLLGFSLPGYCPKANPSEKVVPFGTITRQHLLSLVRDHKFRSEILRALGYGLSGTHYKDLAARAQELNVILPGPQSQSRWQDVVWPETDPREYQAEALPADLGPVCEGGEALTRQQMIDVLEAEIKVLADEVNERVAGIKQRRKVQAVLRELGA